MATLYKNVSSFDVDQLPSGRDDVDHHLRVDQERIGRGPKSKSKTMQTVKGMMEMASSKVTFRNFVIAVVLVGVVFAFAAVFYRIAVLRGDVDALYGRLHAMHRNKNVAKGGFEPRTQHSTQENESGDSLSVDPGCECSVRGQRSRRSVSGSGGSRRPYGNQGGTPSYGSHFAHHLVPFDTNFTISRGSWFKWRDRNPVCTRFNQSPGFDLLDERLLQAPVSGFYFVYSQVTFEDSIGRGVGHQLIKWTRCARGTKTILMESSITQRGHMMNGVQSHSRDSGYIGGVVYLSAGDLVGVRPKLGMTISLNVTRTDGNTYFGAYIISRNYNAPPIEEICQ